MSKSTLNPETVQPFKTESMDYNIALKQAEREKSSVSAIMAEHQAKAFAVSGATQALVKLNTEEAKLQTSLDEIRAKQAEQAKLVGQWEVLLSQRDNVAKQIANATYDLEAIAEEIPGRLRYINENCIGQTGAIHAHYASYSGLLGVVVGMERAQIEVTKWLETARSEYAETLQKIVDFAARHGVKS